MAAILSRPPLIDDMMTWLIQLVIQTANNHVKSDDSGLFIVATNTSSFSTLQHESCSLLQGKHFVGMLATNIGTANMLHMILCNGES